MELWQMDIVGGVILAGGVEAKVVTGVDDHSRFCVIAKVVRRQTGRAVCLAFAEGLTRYGIPEEVLTDNGKQFTDRFGKGGEVLFDRICRTNGIVHRLTQPATPTTTGKVERFHQTFRELIDHSGPFADVVAAQAVVDAWVVEYNTRRPHQSLDMQVPADRFFTPAAAEGREVEQRLIPLRLPPALAEAFAAEAKPTQEPGDVVGQLVEVVSYPVPAPVSAGAVLHAIAKVAAGEPVEARGPVEFDRVVPPSGNLEVLRKQFWLGPARSGQVVRFWADTQVIHLSIAGARVKSVRSHLSVADLAVLVRLGACPAGPPPLPVTPAELHGAVEVDRAVGTAGWVSVGNHIIKVNELRAGTRVGVRLDETTVSVFDLDTRELIRVGPNPLTPAEIVRVRGARPAGPPPQPRTDPIRVQRLASNSGIVMVVGQKIALGRSHARKTVTIQVSADMLHIECDDGIRTVRRTPVGAAPLPNPPEEQAHGDPSASVPALGGTALGKMMGLSR
jgi:hypothetical protein